LRRTVPIVRRRDLIRVQSGSRSGGTAYRRAVATGDRQDQPERLVVLTQYGRSDATGFRVQPRAGIESGISLIAGRLDVAEAHRLVVRRGSPRPGVDAVRYATVGDLEDAGVPGTVGADPGHPRACSC